MGSQIVEVMPQHTNTVTVAAGWLNLRDATRPGTFYDHVLTGVRHLAEDGHSAVTAAQVAALLERVGLAPNGNTVYRTLHKLSDSNRFAVPPLERAGRGMFRSAERH